jgi:hypothetical protein
LIPCSLQKSLNLSEVNSPPLSVLKHLITQPDYFSTSDLNL